MFELVKIHEELSKIVGGVPHNISLIIKEGMLVFKLYKRSIIPNEKLITMSEFLGKYKLRLGTIRAVPDGVLSSEVGLEIYLLLPE